MNIHVLLEEWDVAIFTLPSHPEWLCNLPTLSPVQMILDGL